MSVMSKDHPSLGSLGFPEVTHKPKAFGSLASWPDVVLILMHNVSDEGFSVPAHSSAASVASQGGCCAPNIWGRPTQSLGLGTPGPGIWKYLDP